MNPHASLSFSRLGLSALVFIVGSTCLSGLQAQTVYKCGNAYSQVPCPDAQTVQVNDQREPEQKQQADAATQRDAKLAKSLEKERLALERSTAHASKPKSKAALKATENKDLSEGKKLTKITPKRIRSKTTPVEGFVAQVPASGPVPVLKK